MINEFKEYVKANPEARFVEKAISNRGVRLVEQDDIKYNKSKVFYQHFMEKPFLIDGRFMDFAVYVLISSIDPLRFTVSTKKFMPGFVLNLITHSTQRIVENM